MTASGDPIWDAIREEASQEARREPMLASFLSSVAVRHRPCRPADERSAPSVGQGLRSSAGHPRP